MKAYVLKVTIKNTHPPIWRRVVVPAGISFSQLNLSGTFQYISEADQGEACNRR